MSDEVKMLISCVVEKEGKKMVRLSFLRGNDYAEGILPEGIVEKAKGFTEEEIRKLERYIRNNRKDILQQAKEINPLRNWMNG